MFERYTDRARRVVHLAEALAQAEKHAQAGSGHLLLAFMYEGECAAWQALTSLGLTTATVRSAVFAVLKESAGIPRVSHLPMGPRLHTVLQDAASEALKLGVNYVGTEHLLLSAVRDRGLAWEAGGSRGTAIEALARLGVEPAAVRAAMLAILRGYDGEQPAIMDDGQGAAAFVVQVRKRDPDGAMTEMFSQVLLHLQNIERELGIGE